MKKLMFFVTLVIIVCAFSVSFAETPNYLTNFSDVPTWHWAYETVQKLTSARIITGYPDETFRPDNTVTRAEAVKLLMLSLEENAVFSHGMDVCKDISKDHWVSPYLINGKLYIPVYDDNTFRPDEPITRLDFANGVAKAIHISNVIMEVDEKDNDVVLKDIYDLNSQSQDNIKFLVSVGIINGFDDGSFRPYETLTRAQAAKILSLSMTYKNTGFDEMMSKTTSWQIFDPTTGWNTNADYDLDGNLKVSTISNGVPEQLYFDGAYFNVIDTNITTVKKEILYTKNGQEWTAIFYGGDVVELINNEGTYKLINHYRGNEYTFDSEFVPREKAVEILNTEFPYAKFDFVEQSSSIYSIAYNSDINRTISSISASKSKKDANGNILVHVDDLKSAMWSEEVNGDTADRAEFVKNF